MRTLLESKVIELLLSNNNYAEWLSEHASGAAIDAHNGVLRSVSRITDEMLLSLYNRLLLRGDIVPCLADNDGQFLNIRINGMYGGMIADGSIHT